MELKALVKVGLLLFLMGFTATTTVDARFDPSSFITALLTDSADFDHTVKSTTTACCDSCPCTRSIPPQCRCADVGTSCHSACKACRCTRSQPPQCRCADITDFCYDKCSNNVEAN